MEIAFDSIHDMHYRADVLIEDLCLLEALQSDKALIGATVARGLHSRYLFLGDWTITGQFINRENATCARAILRDVRHESTH